MSAEDVLQGDRGRALLNTFFTADTHFNHTAILGLAKRDFPNVREMNSWLIETWNAKVTQERDHVWVLGDFGFNAPTREGTTDLGELFWKLRGVKHLIVGNHDYKNTQVLRLPWESIHDLWEFKQDGLRAVLCHSPLETWAGSWRGNLHFHGHCHGSLQRKIPKRFDVGVDTLLGASGPIPWEELKELGMKEEFVPVDGHGKAGRDDDKTYGG